MEILRATTTQVRCPATNSGNSTISTKPKSLLHDYVSPVLAAFLSRLAYVLIARTYHFDLIVIEPGPKAACDEHFRFAFEIGSIARSIATGHGFSSPFGGNTGPIAWIAPV